MSIVIPVAGTQPDPAGAPAIRALELGPGDEVVPAPLEAGGCPYAACNDAAGDAKNDWLLFLHPQCEPAPGLLDTYLADAPSERCGALVGRVAGGREAVVNLMVRASAHASAGGFHEEVALGADAELCLRLMQAGWDLADRPGARVSLRAGSLRARLVGAFREGAAARWLGRRFSSGPPSGPVASLAPRATGRGVQGLAHSLGGLTGRNGRARPKPVPDPALPGLLVWTDAYPARSETFIYNEVDALSELGWSVRIESLARPARVERQVARRHRIDYLEDDPAARGACSLVALIARYPLRCLRDRRDRTRWSRTEEAWPLRSLAPAVRRLQGSGEGHVHVHFMAGAALSAMRACRIAGVRYSLIGHGYDVFERPRNLPEKMAGARFTAGPCEYTARHLREIGPPGSSVEVVVMGVDAERFHRTTPYPGGRSVIAVGRLVEKKGFRYLIEAASHLQGRGALDRVTIVGDGPLRAELESLVGELRLTDTVEIVDAWGTGPVARLLERADVLAMPAVVAAGGDRDAMPVVVKEAMAMELPVVASDEVGLPELVRPEWGRLVPPRDPGALAAGLAEVLALPATERAAMGARGREHARAHCSIERETVRLSELIGRATVHRKLR